MTDQDDKERVGKTIGQFIPEFHEWLQFFSCPADLYASVGLDSLTAAALIVVLGKLKKTEPPPSIYISLGIWLERRHKKGLQ